MGCLGLHIALTDADVAALRAFKSADGRINFVQETLEEREIGGEWAAESGKAWDAIAAVSRPGRWIPRAGPTRSTT